MAEDNGNGQFKMDVAEFKGFVTAALKAIEDTSAVKFEAIEKMMDAKIEGLAADQKKNYDCMCAMQSTMAEMKESIAVSAAVRKVKDGLWGAMGGAGMTVIVMLLKDFLKIKFFGGGQ